MIDVLLQIGMAKLLVSMVLAGLALAVHRRVDHPGAAHLMWLLVLVVLLLPAVVAVPVLPGEGGAVAVGVEEAAVQGGSASQSEAHAAGLEGAAPGATLLARMAERGKPGLAVAWLAVATVLLGWTLTRALRFRRWLARTSLPAPPELRNELTAIGHRLGLARLPAVHTTTARVSPMVYWAGGRVRLVVPTFLLARLDRQALRTVLAHELAHVRRRDHLVRWIEWLACSAFWWNPVAWWARRELRAAEEASCDALGVTALKCAPRDYANSLLRVMETLSKPPTPATPAFATGVVRGRSSNSLERRLRILASGGSSDNGPRWIRVTGAAAAVCLLPLGLVYCGTAVEPPTALEESSELPPFSTTELIALVDLDRTDPRAAEPSELRDEGPSLSYWIFNSRNGDIGPLPLTDAPVQPMECRLDLQEADESAREEVMRLCSRAMSDHLRQPGESNEGNVCVTWGSRVGGWSGVCDTYGPMRRDRAGGRLVDVPLLEQVRIHLSSTQYFAGREK